MALSALLKKPVKINKIRAGRIKGGLRPQHLKGKNVEASQDQLELLFSTNMFLSTCIGIEVAREICAGNLTGAVVESTEITFDPGNLKSGTFEGDTQTAGYNFTYICNDNDLPALLIEDIFQECCITVTSSLANYVIWAFILSLKIQRRYECRYGSTD